MAFPFFADLIDKGSGPGFKRILVMTFDPATLRYNEAGLIPAIAQDHGTGEVLMMAWMNAEAVARTLESGRVTYWSRSRAAFWVKGESSGHVQRLVEMRVDCDRDCLLVLVDQTGPACHTNRRSCFYTAVREGEEVEIMASVAG
jgi:phosphoribosyl-AMP cyclohydrolase